jgi:hypothetical protein
LTAFSNSSSLFLGTSSDGNRSEIRPRKTGDVFTALHFLRN